MENDYGVDKRILSSFLTAVSNAKSILSAAHTDRRHTVHSPQPTQLTMAVDSSLPKWESIKSVTLEVVKGNSCNTFGQLKQAVSSRLNITVDMLAPWKHDMKLVIANAGETEESEHSDNDSICVKEEEEQDGEDESAPGEGFVDEDSDGEDASSSGGELKASPARSRRKRARDTDDDGCINEAKSDNGESQAMKALKRMAMAMNRRRALIGLKQMDRREAERTLRDRLIAAGAHFSGAYPKQQQITEAQEKRAREADLEGLDMSNVIEGSRRRRRTEASTPQQPKGRRAGPSAPSDSEDMGSDDNDGNGSEKSGATGSDSDSASEFELELSDS